MAKKKTKNKNGMIFGIIALVSAVLTFVSMAFHFVGSKASTSGILGSNSSTSTMTLGDWFKFIDNAEKVEAIISWQIARVLFIVTLVLVGLIAIGLILNAFVRSKGFKLALNIVNVVTIVIAIIFMILMFTGSSALSSSANLGGIIGGSYTYSPYIAPYLITIFAITTSIFTCLATRKTK